MKSKKFRVNPDGLKGLELRYSRQALQAKCEKSKSKARALHRDSHVGDDILKQRPEGGR